MLSTRVVAQGRGPDQTHASALRFLEEHAKDVVLTEGWATLFNSTLLELLASIRMCLGELELFLGILRWAVADCGRQGRPDD